MCVYACMYIYTYVCVCMHVCIYTHTYITSYQYLSLSAAISLDTNPPVASFLMVISIVNAIHTYIHTYVRTHIRTYIHTYIYIYTHTHAYMLHARKTYQDLSLSAAISLDTNPRVASSLIVFSSRASCLFIWSVSLSWRSAASSLCSARARLSLAVVS